MANKKIIATIEITGIEDWNEFQDCENTKKTEEELRALEIDIEEQLVPLLSRKFTSVKCNIIF